MAARLSPPTFAAITAHERHGLGMMAILAMVAAIPIYLVYADWADRAQMKRAWAIQGPPCPVLAPSPAAPFGARRPKVFDYGPATFARRHGHVSCIAATAGGPFRPEPYRVCQFTAPATLAVTVEGRTTVFRPGAGHKATVTVRNGRAECVVGGWFAG